MSADEWGGDLTALESRADVDSLEDLHQRRRQIMPEYSVLRALHGPFGKWDAKRKAMLCAVKVRVRMATQTAAQKITEAAIDDEGHADAQYIRVVDEGIDGATRYAMLDMEISEIEEKIRSREIGLRAYSVEAGLR